MNKETRKVVIDLALPAVLGVMALGLAGGILYDKAHETTNAMEHAPNDSASQYKAMESEELHLTDPLTGAMISLGAVGAIGISHTIRRAKDLS